MWFCGVITTILLVLAGSCFSQATGGVDQTVALPKVQKILSAAQLSGSLKYWGVCDVSKPRPDLPRLRSDSGHGGSARDALQQMFADDTKMRITQENNGRIRMAETDVPEDLLELRIHQVSFSPHYHGPKMAIMAVLHSPEVVHFIENHNIATKGGWGLPGDDSIAIHKPSVTGELKDVTVAQALDHILQTFPGFWFYENCLEADGRRTVSIGFLNN